MQCKRRRDKQRLPGGQKVGYRERDRGLDVVDAQVGRRVAAPQERLAETHVLDETDRLSDVEGLWRAAGKKVLRRRRDGGGGRRTEGREGAGGRRERRGRAVRGRRRLRERAGRVGRRRLRPELIGGRAAGRIGIERPAAD